MDDVASLPPLAAGATVLGILLAGAYATASLDRLAFAVVAGRSARGALVGPLRSALALLRERPAITERPDLLLWTLAPACYAAVAALALSVVPLADGAAVADARTGIVVFGAAEALAIVAIFLHGWSPNSHLPLIAGFRFVAVALSYELLSMFVLIATALPAESLQVSAIVRSQSEMWNVVRQPLGLPLWLIVTAGVTFRAPLSLADGRDLAGGTAAEASGRHLLLWEIGRGAMLTVFCAMGAAVFLGGFLGPVLPGWAWMTVKTLALMATVVLGSHLVGRVHAERAVTVVWTTLLPAAFVGLAIAGWEALP